jgi:hypothetical protein
MPRRCRRSLAPHPGCAQLATPHFRPTTWGGVHGPLRPARELPASGGHNSWRPLVPSTRGVRPPGGGQGPPHRRHVEGQ